jgi:uncharacterized protein (TIGR02118 family)
MVKSIALFTTPPDPAAFDSHFFAVHLPLVRRIPGLRSVEVLRLSGLPGFDARYYLMAELTYDSIDALDSANATPEGQAAAIDLFAFAKNLVVLFTGEGVS